MRHPMALLRCFKHELHDISLVRDDATAARKSLSQPHLLSAASPSCLVIVIIEFYGQRHLTTSLIMTDPASIGSGNLPLIPRTGDPEGFHTSGVISWNSLVDTTFNATVGILSRISAAGVDPYTLVVGQALGSQFQFTKLSHQRIVSALETLASFRAIGNTLSFGFGIDHLVRVMARSEQGLLCLTLCGSLGECYSADFAAEIFIEMAKKTQAPTNLQPSILQWKALLEACSGIFSTTKFPLVLDGIMRCHPSYHILHRGFLQRRWYPGCSNPQDLATVLLALARVTCDSLASITIIGGADAGFIAAIADWFFDLSVQVSDGESGSILYQNRPESDFVQISVVFTGNYARNDTQVQIVGKTYRLRDAAELMRTDEQRTRYLGGRVRWTEVLSTMFGPTFTLLLERKESFSAAIGCLACVARDISNGKGFLRPGGPWSQPESRLKLSDRQRAIYLSAESTGVELIETIVDYMPELASLRNSMLASVHNDVPEAWELYVKYVNELKQACHCDRHSDKPKVGDRYCLVAILRMVFRLGQTMSLINNPSHLQPSRVGLGRLYNEIYTSWTVHDVETSPLNEHCIFREASNEESTWRILPNALTVFSRRAPAPTQNMCASSTGDGICAYWEVFAKSSGGNLTSRVTVVPGQIELDGKRHSSMTDLVHIEGFEGTSSSSLRTNGWQEIFGAQGSTNSSISFSFDDMPVLARETTTGLQIAFEIPKWINSPSSHILIRPGRSLKKYMVSKSVVSCGKIACTKHLQDAEIKDAKPGLTRYSYRGLSIDVFDASLPQQWYLGNCWSIDGCIIYCIDDQCIDCCLGSTAEYILRQSYYEGCIIVRAAKE